MAAALKPLELELLSHVPSVRPACAARLRSPHSSCLGRHPDPSPFNNPAKSCHAGSVCHWGWLVFASQQMSVEGRAQFWVTEVQSRTRPSSCSQGHRPHLGEQGWDKCSRGRDRGPCAPQDLPCCLMKSGSAADSEAALRWRILWRPPPGLMPPLSPTHAQKQQAMPLTDALPPPAHGDSGMLSERPRRLLKGRGVCQFCPRWW